MPARGKPAAPPLLALAAPQREGPERPSRRPQYTSLGRRGYTLSRTMGLSCRCSLLAGEHPNTDATLSVSLSNESMALRGQCPTADGIADLFKPIPLLSDR